MITMLALYGLVVMATIIANVLTAMRQVGLATLSYPRDDMPPLTGVAGRVDRALANSVVAMALFAPAAVAIHATGRETALTLLAAQIFLGARIVYVLVYAAGTPFLRTGVWVVAHLCIFYLYLALLGAAEPVPA